MVYDHYGADGAPIARLYWLVGREPDGLSVKGGKYLWLRGGWR